MNGNFQAFTEGKFEIWNEKDWPNFPTLEGCYLAKWLYYEIPEKWSVYRVELRDKTWRDISYKVLF